ncbi:sulfite exporter TauE/SafE family protein [Halapricum salinum]|uniref:Probable membrane transporter protein n=1 Tax=Halapricum salinum TaxID=1457250 RepID=A0A4D6HE69_9EURY|nr:sulfite exporter TauE/SafE family protein [Halapricum salinum]QCC51468.1 sulfite exporter TauE/SafE family protein [Halapricum salinum]
MVVASSPVMLVGLVAVVLLAGAVNGLAGFGFALVGTMALATVIDPPTAVVFMIAPILAVNVSLVRELSLSQLQSCGKRFGPLVGAALVGTVFGLAVIDRLPQAPLKVGLGLLSLAFVLTAQQTVALPGFDRLKRTCFVETTPAMVAIGGVSGALFGGTNVGVQFVAYVRSRDLPDGLFVGILAMIFLGLNGVRLLAAGALGLYPSATLLLASVAAAIPAVLGVAIGSRLRSRVTERHRRAVVLGLLTVIGVRLVVGGLGVA